MITTHYVCSSTKSEHWSYKKAKKRLFEVAKITKTFGYKFIEFTG